MSRRVRFLRHVLRRIEMAEEKKLKIIPLGGVDEIGKDKATGKTIVKVNPQFFRPAEVDILLGNPAKAEKELGWKREISFSQLVERMVKNDLALVEKEIKVKAI